MKQISNVALITLLLTAFSLFAQGGFEEADPATKPAAPPTSATAAKLAKKIPCGTIIRKVQLVGDDHQEISKCKEKWTYPQFGAFPELAPDEKFAIVTIRLDQRKSIGKYDYLLTVMGEQDIKKASKCLAMKKNDLSLNPFNWVYYQKDLDAKPDHEIRLLFKVKISQNYTLKFAYDEVKDLPPSQTSVDLLSSVQPSEFPAPKSYGEADEAEPEPSYETLHNTKSGDPADGGGTGGGDVFEKKPDGGDTGTDTGGTDSGADKGGDVNSGGFGE